jgi:FixJ family two-component response regulator
MTSTDEPTVFIIDDDARMRAAMQRLLKPVGLRASRLPRHRICRGTSGSRTE